MAHLSHDKATYFDIQYKNAKSSILPFIQAFYEQGIPARVLEIGSAEGGVLKAFVEQGSIGLGVELSPSRVKLAKEFQSEAIENGRLNFISKDIHAFEMEEQDKFDLIILKDVIEHIHDQEKFMKRVGDFLAEGGYIFFGFPAWRMPYGGHQQICVSKIASKLPYYHLLPRSMYATVLKAFGESPKMIENLLEIKDTRISTARFEKLCRKNNFVRVERTKYFVAPIYFYKFGYKTRKLWNWLGVIPWINDFFTFQSYYLVRKK